MKQGVRHVGGICKWQPAPNILLKEVDITEAAPFLLTRPDPPERLSVFDISNATFDSRNKTKNYKTLSAAVSNDTHLLLVGVTFDQSCDVN